MDISMAEMEDLADETLPLPSMLTGRDLLSASALDWLLCQRFRTEDNDSALFSPCRAGVHICSGDTYPDVEPSS